jgi:hypothetical protein
VIEARPVGPPPVLDPAARPRRRRAWLAAAGAALFFAAATPWALRPWFLARDAMPRLVGTFSAMSNADAYLNVWILAWTAHAVLHAPSRLFDGNVYHPAPHTIAGSENMFAHLPVTVPALAATGNALSALKAMALESFILCGLAMFLFVRHHTGSGAAGLVAGTAFAFAPWRPATIPQPQYLGTQYLVFALLAVDLWLAHRRRRALFGLAAALALQCLACLYVGYFTFIAVPGYAAARLLLGNVVDRGRAALGLLVAMVGGALAAAPAALPYLAARAEGAIPVHDPLIVRAFSFRPSQYFSSATVDRAGAVPIVLALAGLVVAGAGRLAGRRSASAALRHAEAAAWALAALGVLFSAGPYVHWLGARIPTPYAIFYHLVPGFSAIRAPVRFFIVVLAALAALAGYGFARLTTRLSRRTRLAVAVAVSLACVWRAAPAPMAVEPAHLGRATPETHRWLATQPGPGSVLEVPAWYRRGDIAGDLRNARYMVASTTHWHPILNGYTGYPPPNAAFLGATIGRLPDADAVATLADASELRWLVLHRNDLVAWEVPRWREVRTPGLELVARFGNDEIYAVTRAPEPRWRDEIVPRIRGPWPTSLEGTPTTPLAPECRAARLLSVTVPPLIISSPFPQPVPVRFQNASPCPWPGLGVRPEGLVALAYHWIAPSGARFPQTYPTPLAHDVPPGAVVDDAVMVLPAGDETGVWTLLVLLVQDGLDEPLAERAATVEVRPFGGGG